MIAATVPTRPEAGIWSPPGHGTGTMGRDGDRERTPPTVGRPSRAATWFHGKPTEGSVVTAGTRPEAGPRPAPVARLLIALLGVYRRWISPMFLPHCRFHPSCSAYAVEALQVHGVLRGTGLATVRLLKCAPWHPGGLDPVPPRRDPSCASPDGTASDGRAGGSVDPDRTAPRGAGAPISEEQASC